MRKSILFVAILIVSVFTFDKCNFSDKNVSTSFLLNSNINNLSNRLVDEVNGDFIIFGLSIITLILLVVYLYRRKQDGNYESIKNN